VPDGARIRRRFDNPGVWKLATEVGAFEAADFRDEIGVVLSAAHRDHRLENHGLSNLLDTCQRCHVLYDRGFSGVIDPRPPPYRTLG